MSSLFLRLLPVVLTTSGSRFAMMPRVAHTMRPAPTLGAGDITPQIASSSVHMSGRGGALVAGHGPSLSPRQARGVGQGIGRAAMGWQQRLDKALLDVNAKPSARFRNFRKVLQDPEAVLQDVNRAVNAIAKKGFKDGHVEAIDALWPPGTTARKDLEGIQALRKQLPELIENPRVLRQVKPDVALKKVTSGLLEVMVERKKQQELLEEAQNALRQKPRGLKTPSYTVLRRLPVNGVSAGAVELRQYKPFTAARRSIRVGSEFGISSGDGFATLVEYIFGENSDAVAMEMASPVELTYDEGEVIFVSSMLPEGVSANAPPEPEAVVQIPERLVVVKSFQGIATAGEIERQRAALSEILADSGADLRPVNSSEYSVLQYNPPYTLPWRRFNELAVRVELVSQGQFDQPDREKASAFRQLDLPSEIVTRDSASERKSSEEVEVAKETSVALDKAALEVDADNGDGSPA